MGKIFFFLYTLLSVIVYLIALPFLLLFSRKSKYKASIPARFFLWKNPPLKSKGIWFHCCSFGEAKAIKPIVDALNNDILRMSVTTNTGFEVIRNIQHKAGIYPLKHCFLDGSNPKKHWW